MDLTQTLNLADSWGMHGDVGWGWMTIMMIGMLLFWGAIVLGVIWLVRSASWGQPQQSAHLPSKESPVEILERRFAEGSMTLEDYRARRDILVTGESPQATAVRAGH